MILEILKNNTTSKEIDIEKLANEIVEKYKLDEIRRKAKVRVIEELKKEFLNKKLNQYKRVSNHLQEIFKNDEYIKRISYQKEDFKNSYRVYIVLKDRPYNDYIIIYIYDREEKKIFRNELLEYSTEEIYIPSKEELVKELESIKEDALNLLETYKNSFKDTKYSYSMGIRKNFINSIINKDIIETIKVLR